MLKLFSKLELVSLLTIMLKWFKDGFELKKSLQAESHGSVN